MSFREASTAPHISLKTLVERTSLIIKAFLSGDHFIRSSILIAFSLDSV